MTIEYALPYSAEIRAKHCEPDDEIDFGERCGKLTNTEISPLIGKTDCRNLSFHKGALSSFKKHIGKTLNV